MRSLAGVAAVVFLSLVTAGKSSLSDLSLTAASAGKASDLSASEITFGPQARRVLSNGDGSHHALMVPLGGRHGPILRGRSMLRGASLEVDGSREVGYFYLTLGLGTPSRSFELIIDTGSPVTYVPCSDCTRCGPQKGQPFEVNASSTVVPVTCSSPLCNCGPDDCQCFSKEAQCPYSIRYAEGSSSIGVLLQDVMSFPEVTNTSKPQNASTSPKPVRIVFGCESYEGGEIYRQSADGLLGLGNTNNALQSQLVAQKVIENTFYICVGYPDAGVLLLGDVKLSRASEITYTPLQTEAQSNYYNVLIDRLEVGGKTLNVTQGVYNQGDGAILDSGTTYTFLPTEAFNQFVTLVDQDVQAKGLTRRPGPDPKYVDVCWEGGPTDPTRASEVFPQGQIVFEGGTVLPMGPTQYLYSIGGDAYCLGVFSNGPTGTMLGGMAVHNILVQYDRRNNRAGFLPVSSCREVDSMVSGIIPPRSNTTALTPAPPLPPPPPPPPPPAYAGPVTTPSSWLVVMAVTGAMALCMSLLSPP